MIDLTPLRQAVAQAESQRAALGPAATTAQRRAALARLTAARAALDAALRTFVQVAHPDELLARLDPAVPLMLAPVRLETRLRPDGGRPDTLLIRVFPDDVHLEAHEPELTDGEIQQGQRYWTAVWRAGRAENAAGDRARIRLAAWDQLSATLGARARWVARVLAPAIDDRPAMPLPDDATAPAPTFPAVARRGRGWNRPATASTLPDVFVALAYQADRLVGQASGAAVPDVVQVGPDPDAVPAAGGMPLDPALRWLVDFDAAARDGLAVTVPLSGPGYDPTRRPLLSRVLVVGVSGSLDASASAERVARLLSAREREGDAAFVAQGTPTNNTQTGTGPGNAAPDVDELLRAAAGTSVPADPLANAGVLATALGIPAAAVAALPDAGEPEQADARALQLALWSATGDFFVDQLLDSDAGNEELDVDREWLRRHFADHVRARGPLPVLRLGRQPYGLLPVTATARWRPDPGTEPRGLDGLHRTLTTLRPFWDVGVPTLPRVGGPDQPGETLGVPKPERDVLRALGLSPISRAAEVRVVRGALNACYVNNLRRTDTGCGGTLEDRLSAALNRALGIEYQPKISHHQNEARATRLWLPYARLLNLPADTDPVEELGRFLEDVVDKFQMAALAVGPQRARTLLEGLLRHAANVEYGHAAAAVAHHHQLVAHPRLRIPEVLLDPDRAPAVAVRAGVDLRAVTMFSALHLTAPDPAGAGPPPVHQIIQRDRSLLTDLVSTAAAQHNGVLDLVMLPQRPWSARLAEIDAALRYLGVRARAWRDRGQDAFAAIERLLGECLDLVSHRLDAWITSLATARLAAMRAPSRRPTGLHLGAYGWLTDLSPREEGSRSGGWVLAPSLAQATTAAILHSGALSHPSDPGAFAVDLSSRRMRVAMTVLDGVRRGQPLGALLGYRLERRLHDARERATGPLELDRVIAPLRTVAPLHTIQHDAPGAQEFIAPHDVVDGVRLADLGTAAVLERLRGHLDPPLRDPERVAVQACLDALHDDVDAIADLLLAESVHQLANGNPGRSGATLDTLAAEGRPPPRPEVLDTPRQGTPVTHHVLIVVPGGALPARGWDSQSQRGRPRALAEPQLDAWASHQLGPADRIRLRVAWVRPDGTPAGATVTEHSWPLGGQCALDVAALAAAAALRTALAAALARQPPTGVPADAVPVLLDPRGQGWARGVVALAEVEAIGVAVAATLAAARPGTAADLAPADQPPPPAAVGQGLRRRAEQARDGLRAAGLAADLDLLCAYGAAAPTPARGPDRQTQVAAAVRIASSRVRLADEALSRTDALAPAAALEAVFGPGFRAVDLVTAANGTALTASLGPGLARGTGDDRQGQDWLERMATVRPATGALADLVLHTQAAGTGAGHRLHIGQTPFTPGDHWVGAVGRPAEAAPATGLVVHGPAELDLSRPAAVAVVDAWTEVIPAAKHTAGACFHFDAPAAQPPHAILLAVAPQPGVPWTVDTLTAVVDEALHLTKVRLVDLRALGWLGRYLPAAYLPDAVLGTVPGIDVKGMVEHAVTSGAFAKLLTMES
jgi:hypothetical protein